MSAYSTNALYKHTVWQEIFGGQKFRRFLKIVSVSKFRVFVDLNYFKISIESYEG